MRLRNVIFLLAVGFLLVIACNPEQENDIFSPTPVTLLLENNFPYPPIPKQNPLTKEGIALGEKLFFDPRLSLDSTISCNNCHLPQHGFSDPKQFSIGVGGKAGFRNSATLSNVAYSPTFNRDGGVLKLELHPPVPIEDEAEMSFSLLGIKERLQNDTAYQNMAKAAYDRPLDGYVVTRALASYLRTFVFDNTAFDRFYFGKDSSALTAEAQKGWQLFTGKGQCSSCHVPPHFSDFSFRNNGTKTEYSSDQGRKRVTSKKEDEGKFRVASLRNISLTAPYMHDGSFGSLEEVLEHYARGGETHVNEDSLLDAISLDRTEQRQIITFLETLNDIAFPELKNKTILAE